MWRWRLVASHGTMLSVKKFMLLLILGYISYFFLKVFFFDSNPYVLIWWTPFSFGDSEIQCGTYKCLVTSNRNHTLNRHLPIYLFYGSNINPEDLPRKKKSTWALIHEESPKNLPMLMDPKIQNLFEISSTFSRHSDMPITLQYLKDTHQLISRKYDVDINAKQYVYKDLAPILYLQKNCDTPIQRDERVAELMKYIKVDSYGDCLNNKKLPKYLTLNGTYDLYNNKLMRLISKYKFVLAIENARCDDYITEKLWRPLIAGSIPIYLGSPTVKDWLPNINSAILIDDFSSAKELADYIKLVDSNKTLYNSYMRHKIDLEIDNKLLLNTLSNGIYGVNDEYIFPSFECYVCERAHTNPRIKRVSHSYYNCEKPYNYKQIKNSWTGFWEMAHEQAIHILNKL